MIYFDKVTKVYPDQSIALDNVSFTVEPNEFVTIVGHSGAGKTTLIRMLIAEDRPTDGIVFFESKNIHHLKRKEMNKLRRRIGTVFQDFRLILNKTAYENIAFAMEVSGHTDKEISSDVPYVLDLVDLGDKMWNFPHQLSGGEKQRVAIARALLRNPKILILDEATSALDSESEMYVQKALEALIKSRTTFIIAHRLSTIKKADKIVVMHEGTITEVGKHEELMAKGGIYKKLIDLQSFQA